MPKLNRRDFLKALGLTGGASALSACNWDENRFQTPVEHILPYVVRPEQVVPGTYTFFATSVLSGPEARTVAARHRDGRVTFISHNSSETAKKIGRPAIGSGSLLAMQRHYNPDRLAAPSKGGAAIDWEEGIRELVNAYRSAIGAGKSVVLLSSYRAGSFVELAQLATHNHAYFWEPLGYDADASAAETLFGVRALPYYGLDKSGYVLSFGAPFLSGWGDSANEYRFSVARDPNVDHRVARFALISGFRDQTGINADDWYAAKAGTEVDVARAIAKLVAQKTGASAEIVAAIGSVDVAAAANAAGLSESDLVGIATNFVASEGVALPGGAAGTKDLAAAVYLINLAAGAGPERFHMGGYAGPIDSYDTIKSVLEDARAGKIGLLLIDDVDLLHALPYADVVGALKGVDLVVSTSSYPSATSKLAGLHLPSSGTLEDWGDEHPGNGVHFMRQPAMSALGDTRSLGDILLSIARVGDDAESTEALPGSWAGFVQQWWQRNIADGDTSADTWSKHVVEGAALTEGAAITPALAIAAYPFAAATPVAGELALYTEAHTFWRDGRFANEPWAQEVPDPLSGNVWGSWLEISVEDAAARGLKRNDLVSLKTDAGTLEIAVEPTEGIAPGNLLLYFGKGQTDTGRYADGYGVNAAQLFKGPEGGAWAAAAATLTSLGRKGGLISLMSQEGNTDENRHFAVHVDADKLGKVGDAKSEEPGYLAAITEMPMDERLTSKGEAYTQFYQTPQHPTYRFGMSVDTNACNGCAACVIACYAENNLAIVGPKKAAEGKHMAWLRINRYWNHDGREDGTVQFLPMMCQHCGRAGCESVCPVLATYHNVDGLNAMVYNRCVGTRYCSNACPYSVRRFNYHSYSWPDSFRPMLNPDVTARQMGVMEKCTFCVQRVRATKSAWKDKEGFTAVVPDSEWEDVPACAEACPSHAITFGNLKDPEGKVSQLKHSARAWQPLAELNTDSAVTYLAKASFHDDPMTHHHGAAAPEHDSQGDAEEAGA